MQLPPIEIGLLISTVNVDRELQNFISIQTNPTTDAIYRITHSRLWERERERESVNGLWGVGAGQTDPTPTCVHAKYKESKLHRERERVPSSKLTAANYAEQLLRK